MATRPLPAKVNIKGASAGLIVQAIIDQDKTGYIAGTPTVAMTPAGFQMAGQYILAEQQRANVFINTLMNKIAFSIVRTVSFYNEMERYTEKGILDYGETIEEIYVGLVEAEQYEWTENINDTMKRLFGKRKQDVATAYHSINFQKEYPVTITYDELRKAFRSYNEMENFIRIKTRAMYTSYIYDNYLINKYMLYRLALDGAIKNIPIQPITPATSNAALIEIKAAIMDSAFIRTTNTLSGKPQAMPRENAVVLRTPKFGATIDVVSLAQAFNLSYTDYAKRQLTIDGFSADENDRVSKLLSPYNPDFKAFSEAELALIATIDAIVMDEDFFMNYTQLYEMDNAYNGNERYWNYFLHVWKVYGVSPFKTVYMFSETANGTVTGVNLTPKTPTLSPLADLQFSATINTTGFVDKSLKWEVSGSSTNEDSDDATYIGIYGLLHVGGSETAEYLTVTVSSVANPNIKATTTVTIEQPVAEQNDEQAVKSSK